MADNIRIIKKIGDGAFSECFLGRNYNNNLIAIKKSKNEKKYEGITSAELREFFCLLLLQDHKNIVPLYEISINNNNEYILVMKYIPLTLNEFIKNKSKNKYIVSFIRQLLSVIYFMHINNITHTDIKPTNILIQYNKDIDDIHLYLIDFGSSNIDNLTQKYSIVSTYITRAPEIYNYDGNYDNKIDIWSFGIVLYYYIFGENYLDNKKFYDKSDIDRLKYIYDIQNKLKYINFDDKLKYLLLKIFIIDPSQRLDIFSLINLFESLYNMKIIKYKKKKSKKILFNNYHILLKLKDINKYISSRLNYINLTSFDVAQSIYHRLNNKIHKNRAEIEILFICWFINYQFVHTDVDYDMHDILPVFNSYCNKIYNSKYLCELTYDILDNINFHIY